MAKKKKEIGNELSADADRSARAGKTKAGARSTAAKGKEVFAGKKERPTKIKTANSRAARFRSNGRTNSDARLFHFRAETPI